MKVWPQWDYRLRLRLSDQNRKLQRRRINMWGFCASGSATNLPIESQGTVICCCPKFLFNDFK